MSWQSKVLGLCKKYGSSAKFAASTLLGAVLPGSPAVISLVEMAFDAAQQSGQDVWEINVAKQLQTTAENQARLEQLLDVLSGDLQKYIAKIAYIKQMPDQSDEEAVQLVEQVLATAKANHGYWRDVTEKLNGIAHRFDRLEQHSINILTVVEETRTLVRGLAPGANSQAPERTSSKNTTRKVPLAELLVGEWKAGDKSQEIRSLILDEAGRYTMTYINGMQGLKTDSGTYTLAGHIVAIAAQHLSATVLRLEVEVTGEGAISAEPTSSGSYGHIFMKAGGSAWIQWSTQQFIRV
jgi:hypothetical protein